MKTRVLLIHILLCCCLWTQAAGKMTSHELRRDYLQWATRIADSQMRHNPELWMADFVKKPKWDYTQGLVAKAMLQAYETTDDTAYLGYVKQFADYFVGSDGSIRTYKLDTYNIDRVNGGNFLYDLYRYYPEERFLQAIELLRSQLLTQPRTEEGGFWHKNIYPHQMWLDGLYMGEVFYARYAATTGDYALFDDIVNQFMVVDKHTLDAKTGLNYHGWDESKEQAWADPRTGCSPNFWSRSIGWYAMALCDVLEYMPSSHPKRAELQAILERVCKSLMRFQDKRTGMWYQVTNYPKRTGNYLESTASAMFCYAMAKGARLGYLDESYLTVARNTFRGMTEQVVRANADGTVSLTQCCAVAGLGGKPYRDGTYVYYVGETVRDDDPKGIGPFLMAAIELSKSAADFVVAQDGTGDFRTIQAAIDAVPAYRKERTVIRIKPGIYRERIIIPACKQLVSLVGDDAERCVITYGNAARTVGVFGEMLGTSGSATFYTEADDLYMENLTIENAAGEGKQIGQAVAAHVSGDRAVFFRCRFLGNQDTLFTYAEGSRQYYKECYIEGTTDFVFGWSAAVFNRCTLHSKKNSYITAASTPRSQSVGYVFLDCTLTAAEGVDSVYLGRPWREYAKTVFIGCRMGGHIRAEGWHNWHKPQAEHTAFYAEYGNQGEGAPTDKRAGWAKQLTAEQAADYTPQQLLKGTDGWNPEHIRIYYLRK